jgi:hypothetical protein
MYTENILVCSQVATDCTLSPSTYTTIHQCHIPRLLDADRWHTGLFVTAHGSARTFRRRDCIHIFIAVYRDLRYLYFFTNKECVEPKMKHLLLQRK